MRYHEIIDRQTDLTEGPLRNIGMAATVAAGLMSHASAQTLKQPDPVQSIPIEQIGPAERVGTLPTDDASTQNMFFRAEIVRKVGTLPQFMAKAKASGSTKSDADLIDDWMLQCAYATGKTPQQVQDFLQAFDRQSKRPIQQYQETMRTN